MGKVIAKLGIKKKSGHLYYIDKNGNVVETMMAQMRKSRDSMMSNTMDGLAGKKKATKKAATKKTATKKAAPKKARKTGLIMVPQTARGKAADRRLKAKSPGRRVSKSGNKYSERRSNRAD
jgi:hypothetical protein